MRESDPGGDDAPARALIGGEADTLAGLLGATVQSLPDQLALIIDERRVTYQQLSAAAHDVAAVLVSQSVEPGAHVGLLGPNSVAFIEGFFGIAAAGGVAVPLSHRATPAELRHALDLAAVDVLLVIGAGWRRRRAATDTVRAVMDPSGSAYRAAASRPRAVIWLDEVGAHGSLTAAALTQALRPADHKAVAARTAAVSPDAVAALIFTSGTESRPKAVRQTGRAMTVTALARWREALPHSPGERVWVPTPLCHSGALLFMLGALGSGLTLLTASHFDADQASRAIDEERACILWPQFPAIVQSLDDALARSPRSLGHVRQVAVYQTRACLEQTARIFPSATVISGYGSTELNAYISGPRPDQDLDTPMTTCGRPFTGIQVAIVDPSSGEAVLHGQTGEIVVRGPCVFAGYHEDPVATAAAIDPRGWFHTGDLGVAAADGTFTLTGRLKDILKVGGINVAPTEVEAVLLTHPAVRVAAVVGVQDSRLDEVPVAFVETHPGSEVDDAALDAHCTTNLASYKRPRWFRRMGPEDWPMSLTKIDKVALRRQARAAATSVPKKH